MDGKSADRPDWRDASAYAPLLQAERSLFAWEWLRRDPRYCAASRLALLPAPSSAHAVLPEEFGLVAFESPSLGVPDARPLWCSAFDRHVIDAELTRPALPLDAFSLANVRRLARVVEGPTSEHLLLSDGFRTIRLDAPHGTFACEPLSLRYVITGVHSAEAPILALRRFIALCRKGRFSRSLHQREPRAPRWILMLRTHDALAGGASQREIAEQLLSSSVAKPRWRTEEPSVRSQVQRLVRAASICADGGYLDFLG